MKVVNIIQRYPPAIGGSEKWCQENCQFMAKKGMEVKVLTTDLYQIEDFFKNVDENQMSFKFGRLEYDGRVLVKRYKTTRFPEWCYRIFTSPLWSKTVLGLFFHSPHSWRMYLHLLKEIRDADLVHLHTLPYFHNFVGLGAAKLLGKKIICTPHFHSGHPHYERKMNYWLLRQCDGVLTVSKTEKIYLEAKGIPPKKLFDSGNWINAELYQKRDFPQFKNDLFLKYQIQEGNKIILFIGKKYFHKGLDTLMEAVNDLNAEAPFKTFLFLVGPGTEEFNAYYNCLQSEEKKYIIDLGVIPHQQKVNLLHLCDLLVLPSKFEAFGIVFLEAWVCGKPVITCPFLAFEEIVGDAGLFSEFGDKKGLKDKMKTVLSDEALARQLGENGRKRVLNKFLFHRISHRIYDCYASVRNHKKKILFVSHLFPPHFIGGSELVAYQQAMELKRRGHEVEVFCGKLNNQAKQYELTTERGPLKITRINLHQADFDHLLQANVDKEGIRLAFNPLLDEFSPDIVHFHNIYSLAAKIIDDCHDRHIPMVMTLHDYWPICPKNIAVNDSGKFCPVDDMSCLGCQVALQDQGRGPLSLTERNRLLKTSFNKINSFISPSQYLADVFSNSWLKEKRIRVIPNGIDLRRFNKMKKIRRKKNGPIQFAFIGYLARHKGTENLLLAFSLLKNKEKAQLILAGKSSSKYYEDLTEQMALGRYIRFLGQVPNNSIDQLYCQADVLVLPSLWPENSPVSIMEAMACGIPVIASDVGGIKELVEDGVTGRLFPYWDYEQLAKHMEEFINNPGQMEQMGQKGYEKVQRWHLENQVDLVLQEYDRVIHEHA
ncbi:MAG: glycosyltransferase [Candidatus Omnitrophica bacterium]|nr:glycosyltransferase [Candidatus Omnitrophota bacterium]